MEGTIYSLLPPLVAILLCIFLREAVVSLFVGIFVGALFLNDFYPHTAFFRAMDDIILSAFTETDHSINIMFTVFMGGMIEVLNQSPSARLLIRRLAARLRSRRRAGAIIWGSGMFFFVDDYANALIVGNSYRKIVDGLRISREKLAYLVDTTSAPITSLALVSTWIGFEISTIKDTLVSEAVEGYTGYGLFLSSIPYRFYPLLALFFCLIVVLSRKDFGPMLSAERRALQTDPDIETSAKDKASGESTSINPWIYLVFAPIFILLFLSVAFLIANGLQNGAETDWSHPWQSTIAIFSEADPFRCLLWATMVSCLFTFSIHTFVVGERFLEVFGRWLDGCKGMFLICVILTLAWSIGDVCTRLKTGDYVASLLGSGFDLHYLPLLTFFFAAGISFATGTSFGTMSILMPIVLPIALRMGGGAPDILYGTVGSVLGGAIFGDHCSPLSDTTILSSGASGCPVTSHVNTQLPYALIVAVVSGLCLVLTPIEWIHPLLLVPIGLLLLAGVHYAIGTDAERALSEEGNENEGRPKSSGR